MRSPETFLASKIFEIKRRGIRDDNSTSDIVFDDVWMTRVSLT